MRTSPPGNRKDTAATHAKAHTLTRLDELEFIMERGIVQAAATQAPVCYILSPLLTGGKAFAK